MGKWAMSVNPFSVGNPWLETKCHKKLLNSDILTYCELCVVFFRVMVNPVLRLVRRRV